MRWTTWLGSLALFVAAALFLHIAIARGWIGPAARVGLASAFGLALLAAGYRATRRSMRTLGQSLLGAGLAVLHVAVFAGFRYSSLYPQAIAFALLVTIVVVGIILAVRLDARSIAMLALVGGLLTPPLVSTGGNARDALFAYLTVLNLGVLGVAFFKRWRALDVLAFAGTWVLYGGWFARDYEATSAMPTLAWLAVFYAIFLLLPFVHHLRRQVPLDIERFVAAIANAVVAFGFAQQILGHDSHLLGSVALAMSAGYVVLGALARRRLPDDGRAIAGFATLAMVFLTLSIPLYLRRYGLVLGWSFEGPVLLYLGYRYRYYLARLGGMVVLGLAIGRLAMLYAGTLLGGPTGFEAARLASALVVPAAFGVYAVLHHRFRAVGDRRDAPLRVIAEIVGGLLALGIAHVELELGAAPHAAAIATALWTIGAAGFLAAERSRPAMRPTSLVAAAVAMLAATEVSAPVGWAVLAPALVALGARRGVPALRALGAAAAVLALATLVPAYADLDAPSAARLVRALTVPACTAALVALLRGAADPRDRGFATAAWLATGFSLLGVGHIEIGLALDGARPAQIALWAAGALAFLVAGRARRAPIGAGFTAAIGAGFAAAIGAGFALDAYAGPAPALLALNARFAASLAVVAAVAGLARALRRTPASLPAPGPSPAAIAAGTALALLWLLLGVETYRFVAAGAHATAAQPALTIVWGVYAVGLVASGFRWPYRSLRIAGLALFGLTAGKLVLVDLAGVDPVYRALSFLVLGLLLTASSYLYHRFLKSVT